MLQASTEIAPKEEEDMQRKKGEEEEGEEEEEEEEEITVIDLDMHWVQNDCVEKAMDRCSITH